MIRWQRSLYARWLMMAVLVVTCGKVGQWTTDTSPEVFGGPGGQRLPREVLAVQQAVRKRLGLETNNPLLKRIQRQHRGTDVLAYQLPTRMRPIEVHRSGAAMWRLSALTAQQVGQVPVVVVLGRATVNSKSTLGGQLFVVGLCDPGHPKRTRICMMFTTSVSPVKPSAKRDS